MYWNIDICMYVFECMYEILVLYTYEIIWYVYMHFINAVILLIEFCVVS